MQDRIFAIAVIRPFDQRQSDVIALLTEFYAMLERKGYSHDKLFHDARDPGRLLNFRYWNSDDARREAAEDPDVHRFWHRLGEMADVETVYEELHEIEFR
ncbi:MAG TPA: hypothetical protein VN577_09490 [Terriglobales bacterium]|nr:hypothetical protein [Terriglobales bacterium]